VQSRSLSLWFDVDTIHHFKQYHPGRLGVHEACEPAGIQWELTPDSSVGDLSVQVVGETGATMDNVTIIGTVNSGGGAQVRAYTLNIATVFEPLVE